MEHRNIDEPYFGCGEDPSEIEKKYKDLIKRAEEQSKNTPEKKHIVVIIDIENKIGRNMKLFKNDTEKLLKSAIKSSDELWIFKIDFFDLSINYTFTR